MVVPQAVVKMLQLSGAGNGMCDFIEPRNITPAVLFDILSVQKAPTAFHVDVETIVLPRDTD